MSTEWTRMMSRPPQTFSVRSLISISLVGGLERVSESTTQPVLPLRGVGPVAGGE
jgi:hypothetical protein